MTQKEYLIKRIDSVCHDIWSMQDGTINEVGQLIQDVTLVLQNIINKIEKGELQNLSISTVTNLVNLIVEGLQCKDQMEVADILYFELKEMIAMYGVD